MKAKKKSGRTTLKKKYSIEGKVKEHKRRVKKLLRKGALNKRFKRKDPGIPNSWPFKAEMLKQIQKEREEKARERELEKAGQQEVSMDDTSDYARLRERAEVAGGAFAEATDGADGAPEIPESNSTKTFFRALREVVQKADVIVEVLDARDPQSCRNLEVEREIVADGKKLVLLLNKVDLVPKEVVDLWVAYLSKSHPVIPFKSALTTKISRPISHCKAPYSSLSESELQLSSQVVGANALIQLLKNYSRSSTGAKTSITVGFIGVPNVGKSSVLNSLCRKANAAAVGGEPGVTRCLKEIHFDSKLSFIDTPGTIATEDVGMVLRNAIKLSTVKNPIEIVDALLTQYPVEQVMKFFKVPAFATTSEFLTLVAQLRGKLSKGGGPNFHAAALWVLTEWTSGKVLHFVLPPKEHQTDVDAREAGLISGPRIVTTLGEPFNFDSILQ